MVKRNRGPNFNSVEKEKLILFVKNKVTEIMKIVPIDNLNCSFGNVFLIPQAPS